MNLCSTCHFYEDTLPNLQLGTCHEPPGGVRTARGSWCSRWRANGVITQEDVNKVKSYAIETAEHREVKGRALMENLANTPAGTIGKMKRFDKKAK